MVSKMTAVSAGGGTLTETGWGGREASVWRHQELSFRPVMSTVPVRPTRGCWRQLGMKSRAQSGLEGRQEEMVINATCQVNTQGARGKAGPGSSSNRRLGREGEGQKGRPEIR